MKSYIQYGFREDDLESARDAVEQALGIRFHAHESLYRGGDYYRFGSDGEEHFILQKNFNNLEKEWATEAFQDMAILLYVNETSRPEEIKGLLTRNVPEILMLRTEEL